MKCVTKKLKIMDFLLSLMKSPKSPAESSKDNEEVNKIEFITPYKFTPKSVTKSKPASSTPKKCKHAKNVTGFKKRNRGFTQYNGKRKKRQKLSDSIDIDNISVIDKIDVDQEHVDLDVSFEDIVPLPGSTSATPKNEDVTCTHPVPPEVPSANSKKGSARPLCFDKQEKSVIPVRPDRLENFKFLMTDPELIQNLLRNLDQHGLIHDFLTLMRVLANGRLHPRNIAILLCFDRAILANCKYTNAQQHRKDSLCFWELFFKLCHGQGIRFLAGPGHKGDGSKRSQYDPVTSKSNFNVPSIPYLTNATSFVGKRIKPGFIEALIKLVPRDRQYVLAFDGKYVSEGLREYGCGDINLWGLEGPPSLESRRNRLDRTLSLVNQICTDRNLTRLPDLLQAMSFRLKDLREVSASLNALKQKLEKSISAGKKYTTALGTIMVKLHTTKGLVRRILNLNREICSVMSKLNDSEMYLSNGSMCNIADQSNYLRLLPADQVKHVYPPKRFPHLCKQGSEEWLQLRKLSPVTGSSVHNAIGMRGLAESRRHYKKYVDGEDLNFSPQQLSNMEHGKANEINGIATLTSVLQPALKPKCAALIEVGAYFLDGTSRPKIMEVSPDGKIACCVPDCDHWSAFDTHYPVAVEVKCPTPKGKEVVQQHYSIPPYYFLQVQSEMQVLNTDKAWYICYTDESTTLLEIIKNDAVWQMVRSQIDIQFDVTGTPKKLKTLPPVTKHLKDNLAKICAKSSTLLAEVPSVKAYNLQVTGDVRVSPHTTPALKTASHTDMLSIMEHVGSICLESKKLLHECFELQRRSATEMVVFLLSDTDRMYEDGIALNFPIAYAMKGYALPIDKMRGLLDMVRDRLKEEGIDVLVEAYDGQWNGVMVRDRDGKPLTRHQLAKDTYKQVLGMSKEQLLAGIAEISSISNVTLDVMFGSGQLEQGTYEHGNLTVHIRPPLRFDEHFYISRGKRAFLLESRNRIMSQCQQVTKKTHPALWHVTNDRKGSSYSIVREHNTIIDFLPSEFIDEAKLRQIEMNRGNEQNPFEEEDTIIFDDNDIENIMYNEDAINHNVQQANSRAEDENEIDPNVSMMSTTVNITEEQLSILDTSFRRKTRSAPRAVTLANEFYSEDKAADIKQIFNSVGEDFMKNLLTKLQQLEKKNQKIVNIDHKCLFGILSDANSVYSTFTMEELRVIENMLRDLLKVKFFKSSTSKTEMCNIIGRLFGSQNVFQVKKAISMKSLKELCTDEVMKRLFPKKVIAATYGRALNVLHTEKWEGEAPIEMNFKIHAQKRNFAFYGFPEFSTKRNQFEPRILDPTHILTNVRNAATQRGLPELGVKRDHWLHVTKKFPQVLSLGYVTECVEKQSAAVAKKVFSEEVEKCMEKLGYHDTAKFVKRIRHFYDACDTKYVDVNTRIEYLTDLHDYLTSKVDFHKMPPQGTHIMGISIVTYEGLLMNCSIRIMLYRWAKKQTYNPRAIGTLAIESLFADFALRVYSGTGNVQSVQVEKLWSDVAVINYYKHTPDKCFYFQTSSHPTYPVTEADFTKEQIEYLKEMEHHSQFKPHLFDLPKDPNSRNPRKRQTQISRAMEPLRGALPLRAKCQYRLNEANINPLIRNGLLPSDVQ